MTLGFVSVIIREKGNLSQQLPQHHILVVQDPFFILQKKKQWTFFRFKLILPDWCFLHSYSGYLDNRVEQNNSRLLCDDLLRREMMLDELRNGGEACPFKPVLTLQRETVLTPTKRQSDENFFKQQLTSAYWIMKCRLWSSENTDRTYSPGLPWLSLTRKSPCCRSNSWASVRGIAPWYHSCSARGRSDVGMTSKNCFMGKQSKDLQKGFMDGSNYKLWQLYDRTNRGGGAQHGFGRPKHPRQRVPQRVQARALLLCFILNTHTHKRHHTHSPKGGVS